jgi:hypothetical protein
MITEVLDQTLSFLCTINVTRHMQQTTERKLHVTRSAKYVSECYRRKPDLCVICLELCCTMKVAIQGTSPV